MLLRTLLSMLLVTSFDKEMSNSGIDVKDNIKALNGQEDDFGCGGGGEEGEEEWCYLPEAERAMANGEL